MPFALVVGFMLLGGAGLAYGWYLAGDGSSPQAEAQQSAAPTPSLSPSRAQDDFLDRNACQLAATWIAETRTDDYELAQRIADSAKAALSPGIRFQGQMLNERLKLAKASLGARDHPALQQDMVEAMGDLHAECVKQGLG